MDARTGVTWNLSLLGGFHIKTADGRDVTPPGRKLRALIACLALAPEKGWSRERLATLLWGDRDDDQARASLRQALAELRRILGEPSVQADRETVAFDITTISIDAAEFARLTAAGLLNEAAALYRGDLLEGVNLPDAGFSDWLVVERAQLRGLAIDVLTRLAAAQTDEAAIATAQRLIQLDPLHEGAHRILMRLYAASGQRALFLRQYQICRDSLERELDVKPEAETERLFRELHSHRNKPDVPSRTVDGLDDASPVSSAQSPPTREIALGENDDADSGPGSAARKPLWKRPDFSLGSMMVVVVALVLAGLVGATVIEQVEHDGATRQSPPVIETPEAAIGLPIVVVLPFQYLAGDTVRDNLGVGIAADICDLLWNFPEFQVISASSAGISGGQNFNISDIAKKYGAQFVIGGAVRRSGNEVVVTAQLIDGTTGVDLWSGRFAAPTTSDPVLLERMAAEKFAGLLGGMTGKMRQAYERIAWRKNEAELTEYDYYVRGHAHHHRFRQEDLLLAREIYLAGLKRYPNSVLLRTKMSLSYVTGIYRGWDVDLEDDAAKIRKYAKEAAALLAAGGRTRLEEAHVYWALAYAHHTRHDFPRCIADAQAAVAISPYDPFLRADLANAVAECGKPETGVEWSMEAMRQEPTGIPSLPEYYEGSLARSLYLEDRCPEAIAVIQRMQNPEPRTQAACSVRLGQITEARRTMDAFLADNPGHNLDDERTFPMQLTETLRQRWLDDMRMAGMPEKRREERVR